MHQVCIQQFISRNKNRTQADCYIKNSYTDNSNCFIAKNITQRISADLFRIFPLNSPATQFLGLHVMCLQPDVLELGVTRGTEVVVLQNTV